jgi:hypothetical protein
MALPLTQRLAGTGMKMKCRFYLETIGGAYAQAARGKSLPRVAGGRGGSPTKRLHRLYLAGDSTRPSAYRLPGDDRAGTAFHQRVHRAL